MTETEIATVVRAYWNARGYVVDVTPRDVAVKGNAGTAHYIYVRSNLIGGLPPGYRDLATPLLLFMPPPRGRLWTGGPRSKWQAAQSAIGRSTRKYDTKTLAQMRRLWEDAPELAAARIGEQFGVSKNAVISQANRRGWKHRRKLREPTAAVRRIERRHGR